MVRSLESIVGETRKDLDRTQGRFVAVSSQQERARFYGRQYVQLDVDTTLFTRPSGTTDPFTEVGQTRSSVVSTRRGRELVAASTAGDGSVPDKIAYGDGTGDDADVTDTTLSNKTGDVSATVSATGKNVRVESDPIAAPSYIDNGYEVGIIDDGGALLTREVFDATGVDPSNDDVKFETEVTISGRARGTSQWVAPYAFEQIADAVVSTNPADPFRAFVYSDTQDTIQDYDQLPNEVLRQSVTVAHDGTSVVVTASVPDSAVSGGSPYDIVQVGVHDDSNRLVWLANSHAITVDDRGFVTQAQVTVQ
jgi:hypothetical protein